MGLSDLNNAAKEDEERNELYTGGNRRGGGGSGLSVIGPDDDVESMFARATSEGPSSETPKRVITMYANGFTVDDGPFRALDDPENAPFLSDVAKGLVPRELEDSVQSSSHFELVDRRGELYTPPSFTAFAGAGQTLGTEPAADLPTVTATGDQPTVDADQPTTTIQVRLANGTRLRATLNLSHTVADLEAYVRANSDSHAFVLLAGYPPVRLDDKDKSILDAGLKGASVTQKST